MITPRCLRLAFLIYSLLTIGEVEAQSDISGCLLIRNVVLIDQPNLDEGVVVNLLIGNEELKLVTEEAVSVAEVEQAFDAQNGVLMGQLELGESPSFMILDGDPRENFRLLLETERHTTFAIVDGNIVRNRLSRAMDSGAEPRRPRWVGYNPPRFLLATSYRDPTKWHSWKTKPVSGVFAGVVALDRTQWLSQNAASHLQVGDLDDFSGGDVRAFEIGAVGTLNFDRPWVYTIFAANGSFDDRFNTKDDNEFIFRDVRLDIPVTRNMTLAVGKQKEPISLERISSLLRLPYQERSASADAMMTSRNVGAVLSGTGFNQRMTWAGGVFNDWLDDEGSFSDNSTQFVGRLTWLPYLSEDESNILHLGLGARHSDAEEGVHLVSGPEISQAPPHVDTGLLDADQHSTYNLEVYWRSGPVWVGGEYTHTNVDLPARSDLKFTGYHLTASWVISGEMRGYNKRTGLFAHVPVSRSTYQDGWGAWEVFTRWSTVDLTDRSIEGGEMQVLSVGFTWWLTSFFNLSGNYRHVDLDRFNLDGVSDGFNLRMVMMLD